MKIVWEPTRLQACVLLVGGIAVLIAFMIPLVVLILNYSAEQRQHTEERKAIAANCETMGADYGFYYDSGNDQLPVCRTPTTEKEWQVIREQRAYSEGLRSGDIDPDTGDPAGLNEFPY